MRTLLGQLQDAFARKEMSLAELLRKSGLDMNVSNLSRRMSGEVPFRLEEAEAVAVALDVRLVWNSPRRAARRAA